MADEIDATVDLEPAQPGNQPAPEADEPDDLDDDYSGEPREAEPEETFEFEDGDKKAKLPKWVKDAVLRQSDYSRNMNDLKAERERFSAEREQASQWRDAEEKQQQTLGELAWVNSQLKQFEEVTPQQWNAWQMSSDPNVRQRAQASWQQKQFLTDRRTQLKEAYQQGQQEHETGLKRKIAERFQATQAFAEREIPNWSPERNKAIGAVVDSAKLTEGAAKALTMNMEPGVLRLLDLALDGHRYREAVANRKKQQKSEESNVTPLPTVSGRGGGSQKGLSDKQSTADWIRQRNEQAKRKAG